MSGNTVFKDKIKNDLQRCQTIIFVYDVSVPESLENMEEQWIKFYMENVQDRGAELYLIGNKADLR